MYTNEKEEKKTPRITELVAIVSVMVSILIAGTSLLSNVANVPWWWFHFSFIILIALTFFIPSVIFYRPISERYSKWKVKRRRNEIARRYFAEFKDIVEGFRGGGIFDILGKLRNNFRDRITEKMGLLPIRLLEVHNRNDVESPIRYLEEGLKECDGTFNELTLLTDQFNIILEVCEKTLRMMGEFVREMKRYDAKIPEYTEREYEEFRERYNDFIKRYNRYCHKLNKELRERVFSEHFDLAKKW